MDEYSDGQESPFNVYEHGDSLREASSVARSGRLGCSLCRHGDILRALHDHETYSSRVSTHLSVPNNMDPPEHGPYRRIVEGYFDGNRVAAFEPVCRGIVRSILGTALALRGEVEVMSLIALPFAARVQCAYLGWPGHMEEALLGWASANQKAVSENDRAELARNAEAFRDLILKLLDDRRTGNVFGVDDLTSRLLCEQVKGGGLCDDEIVSILRNWTAGEIGTISAAVGILADYVATNPALQQLLRDDPSKLPYAIDEMLRIRGPLLNNRRVTTRPVTVGGESIAAGERISLLWISGNRDARAFPDPLSFRWDRDPAANLLYGAGIHVCPGADLSRLELRVFMEELLTHVSVVQRAAEDSAQPARFPACGYSSLRIRLTPVDKRV